MSITETLKLTSSPTLAIILQKTMDKLASLISRMRGFTRKLPQNSSPNYWLQMFPGGSVIKKKKKTPPAKIRDAGDKCLTSGLGRSTGVGNGNPLQYSFLENPMDRGAWKATVPASLESRTQLSDWACKGRETYRRQVFSPNFQKTKWSCQWEVLLTYGVK